MQMLTAISFFSFPHVSECIFSSKYSRTVILFSVSVPVLSEQITLMHPIVSEAIIFFTSAFCLESLIIFTDRETATMVGSPSGTAATMRTIDVTNASRTSCGKSPPCNEKEINCAIKTIPAAQIPIIVMILPNFESFSCNGVTVFTPCNSPAILPNSVESPTAVTKTLQ